MPPTQTSLEEESVEGVGKTRNLIPLTFTGATMSNNNMTDSPGDLTRTLFPETPPHPKTYFACLDTNSFGRASGLPEIIRVGYTIPIRVGLVTGNRIVL